MCLIQHGTVPRGSDRAWRAACGQGAAQLQPQRGGKLRSWLGLELWPEPLPRGCGHPQEERRETRACPELPTALQTTAPKLLSGIHAKPELPTGRAPWEMGSRMLRAPLGSG